MEVFRGKPGSQARFYLGACPNVFLDKNRFRNNSDDDRMLPFGANQIGDYLHSSF
jgi:hypothetical protein